MNDRPDTPDLFIAYVEGQNCAERFLLDLVTTCPAGDDLYHLVNHHTLKIDAEQDAFVRGVLRAIQKRLENLS